MSAVNLSAQLLNSGDADRFIGELKAAGMDFHFEDDPADIISGRTGEALFVGHELADVRQRVAELFDLLDDPFALLLEDIS